MAKTKTKMKKQKQRHRIVTPGQFARSRKLQLVAVEKIPGLWWGGLFLDPSTGVTLRVATRLNPGEGHAFSHSSALKPASALLLLGQLVAGAVKVGWLGIEGFLKSTAKQVLALESELKRSERALEAIAETAKCAEKWAEQKPDGGGKEPEP